MTFLQHSCTVVQRVSGLFSFVQDAKEIGHLLEDTVPADQLREQIGKHMEYDQRKQSKHLLDALLLLTVS